MFQLHIVVTLFLLVLSGVLASIVGGVVLLVTLVGLVAFAIGYSLRIPLDIPIELIPPELVVALVGIASLGLFVFLVRGERDAPDHAIGSIGGEYVTEAEYPQLYSLVRKVCKQASTPVPKLYVVPTETPLSLVTGYSAGSARLALSEGLVSMLDERELEAVVAHEISHVRNHDMAVMTAAALPVGATDRVLALMSGTTPGVEHGQASRADRADMLVAIGLVAILPVWLLAHLLTASLSRTREYAADRGAVALTGNPASLASALGKIKDGLSERPATDLRQSEIAAAAILESEAESFGVRRHLPASLSKYLHTHPDTTRRLDQLRALEQRQETRVADGE
ncbi:M48 family metallopeptidase [Haloprofundus marisrubri]|uniref:M48 family metallopeptidase n=1 Tax=Haloprofundus marisrubri TaxID=1514971 RepID=UPI00138F3E83|nr:M48 family metalloprotease [Haloprofundus marisrubri]